MKDFEISVKVEADEKYKEYKHIEMQCVVDCGEEIRDDTVLGVAYSTVADYEYKENKKSIVDFFYNEIVLSYSIDFDSLFEILVSEEVNDLKKRIQNRIRAELKNIFEK